MKVNISDIAKVNGASLDVTLSGKLEDLQSSEGEYTFEEPVLFKGRLVNVSGIIKLDGHISAEYSVRCCRCLKMLKRRIDLDIKEDFIDRDTAGDSEAYTYEGNFVEFDRVLKDSIILNLPMRQLCSDECKGICEVCGKDLNTGSCSCKKDMVNPQMDVLKNFFKH